MSLFAYNINKFLSIIFLALSIICFYLGYKSIEKSEERLSLYGSIAQKKFLQDPCSEETEKYLNKALSIDAKNPKYLEIKENIEQKCQKN